MPDESPVRLAILGAGTIGTVHALAAQEAPEATVAAVWSRTPARAQAQAARVGAAPCATVDEAVSRDDVDAVVVCTPTFLHREHAIAAARSGKHVICEKPLARDLAGAEAIMEAARGAGVLLLVAQVVRFFPEFLALRQAVLDGAIGQPAVVRMARLSGFPRGRDDWHVRFQQSGGVLLDMGIHDLDWLLWTFGPAERVYARALDPESRPPYVDYALTTLRLVSGVIAHIESSWAETEGFRTCGEVAGDAGLLTYDSAANPPLTISLRRLEAAPGVTVPTSYTTESPYVAQMRHFARCIRGEVEPIIAPEEAHEALRVALAALDAARSGQPVQLT